MTTIEHRRAATLAILADATGPLTPREIAGRLSGLGHPCERIAARRYLEALVGRGLAERLIAPSMDLGNRIYWPTMLGRREALDLESQRIDGV